MSHLSRKTSEIWDTQDLSTNKRMKSVGEHALRTGLAFLIVCLSLPACARTWNAKTDWHATGNGKSDDSAAIQRGLRSMSTGDTVVFPSPGIYLIRSTVHFKASGVRVKCEAGVSLVGANDGTAIFADLKSNTAIGGS